MRISTHSQPRRNFPAVIGTLLQCFAIRTFSSSVSSVPSRCRFWDRKNSCNFLDDLHLRAAITGFRLSVQCCVFSHQVFFQSSPHNSKHYALQSIREDTSTKTSAKESHPTISSKNYFDSVAITGRSLRAEGLLGRFDNSNCIHDGITHNTGSYADPSIAKELKREN